VSKKTIGILFILSVIVFVVGIGLFVAGLIGSATVYDPYTGSNNVTSIGHPALFFTGIILWSLAFVPFLVAWIGALVNLARLQQWVWFVLMFFFSGAFAKFMPLLKAQHYPVFAKNGDDVVCPRRRDAYAHSSRPLLLRRPLAPPARFGNGVP
jgi:hypothetical protein